MRPYLSNYIRTLSRRRQERISNLLEDARVSKEQLSRLVERLQEFEVVPVELDRDVPNSIIRSSVSTNNLQSIKSRTEDLYDYSNLVSTLLNSHSTVLGSEVRAMEEEILAMEKMARNFAFLLSDNQAYDYAFLETFIDNRGRDEDMVVVPDRSHLPFGPAEHADIRADEGKLILPESDHEGYGLSGVILKGNSTAHKIFESDLENVFTRTSTTGWRMILATAGPVTAPLPEGLGLSGAQVVLEFRLSQPAPCSEVRLAPYADMPLEVLQVTIYPDDEDTDGQELLSTPRRLDRATTLQFPMETVLRFKVVLNQPVYHRVTKDENLKEHHYRNMLEEINKKRKIREKRKFNTKKIERMIQSRVSNDRRSVSLPSTDFRADWGPSFRDKAIFRRPDFWRESGNKSLVVYDLLMQDDVDIKDIQRYEGDLQLTRFGRILSDSNSPTPQVVSRLMSKRAAGYNYYYNLGLHHVGIGVGSPGFRGVFVSKTMSSPGDIGEVRLKAEDRNYVLPVTDRHSPIVTSVEYSVSNKSNPIHEGDWRSILPVGTVFVEGERLFVNEGGNAYFRFPSLTGESLSVYRNGYRMRADNFDEIFGEAGATLGITMHPNIFTPEDIFTCDYHPVGDQTVLAFPDFETPPLVAAFDNTGAGERFLSTTSDRNTVTLSFHPYIDPIAAKEGGYHPITVQLDSGEVAQNLTDYRTNKSVPLPPDGYYYIHSGDKLMFNKAISTSFRVYYQYLQNNVRVRTVLRCNMRNFVSPEVDYVHLKAKTRRSEPGQIG